ncbi:MAG: hypothetical protein QHH14_03445 [Clostridiales bacterium]|nr:hypothetical protein [Clostridiales bacterium]
MFSKKNLFFAFVICAVATIVSVAGPGFSQVVDCIAAKVNEDIITLSDIRILQAFGIGKGEPGRVGAQSLEQTLEQAVNRRVVIELVPENIVVSANEVDQLLQRLKKNLGPVEWQLKLDEFGLEEDDLKAYLREVLVYDRIISLRFSQSAAVSLKEIENYYYDVYQPAQKAMGEEPKPMIQILDDIESEIRKGKMESQVALWIKNLRQQAEVSINLRCLEQAWPPGEKR